MKIGFDPNGDREPHADMHNISFDEMMMRLKAKVANRDWDPVYRTGEITVTMQVWRDLDKEFAIHIDGETYYIGDPSD